MKVLFDQNVPRKLRLLLRSHLVMTAKQMGWAALANGNLIRVAEGAGFEVLITADKGFFINKITPSGELLSWCFQGSERLTC